MGAFLAKKAPPGAQLTPRSPAFLPMRRNIAACYGIGKYDDDDEQNPGSLFIVQELIQGGNLLHQVYKQMLNMQRRVYTSQDALTWMIDVAAGMQYLHSVVDGKPMIIHRDLKLENIMLSRAHAGVSVAKLVDFGLHKVIDDRIKRVVKRVASASVLGLKGLRPMAPDEGMEEEEDELEAALRQQAEQKGGGSGGDAGSNSGSGGSAAAGSGQDPGSPVRPGSGGASRLNESPNGGSGGVLDGIRRRMSRLVLASPAMAAMPEEDEEDIALAHAEAATLAAQRAAAAAARDSSCSGNGSSAVDSSAAGAGDGSPTSEKEVRWLAAMV
jgi:hypothetical protein